MSGYVELQVLTHFSLLRGASSPEELFSAAALLGMPTLGVADLGTVGGVVRAWEAQKATGVRSIAGARVDLAGGRRLLLYPTDRPAWSRLTLLLTIGKRRAGKGGCDLAWDDAPTSPRSATAATSRSPGIILVRQKPGPAKGVLLITIEDETGIANGILWPDRFEAQRRTVMSASCIGMRGRVQKEGEVIHVICDRIVDHGDLLARVGEMAFPHRTGRGDGARHAGAPDRGDAGWSPSPRNCYWPPHADGMDPEEAVRVRSRDFR